MKAKDYAKRIDESSDKMNELTAVLKDFLIEFTDTLKKRNVTLVSGIKPTAIEFDKKYKAYANILRKRHPVLCADINEDAFMFHAKKYLKRQGIEF